MVANTANNMDPDHNAPSGAVLSGFIVFTFMNKSSRTCEFEYMQQTSKADDNFRRKIDRIGVNLLCL